MGGHAPCSGRGRLAAVLIQEADEFGPGNFPGPETRQMVGVNLAVDESVAPLFQAFNRKGECRFGRVADAMEHGFTEEYPPDRNPIQAAHQAPALPRLEGMGKTQPMEVRVSPHHLWHDPGSRRVGPGCRTGLDHLGETRVETEPEFPFPQSLAQAPGHLQGFRKQNQPGVGRPP
jgi:hypothetical protein